MRSRTTFALAAFAALSLFTTTLRADDRLLWDQGPGLELSALGPTPYLPWRIDGAGSWSGMLSIPAFRSPGIMFDSNYVRVGIAVKSSWDAAEASGEVDIEPIAFAHLRVGGGIGTGWSIPAVALVGLPTQIGLAINPAQDSKPLQEIPLGGFVWNAWASVPLILNLEYFFLSPWARVVLEVEPRVEYRALSAAGPGVAWMWHDDMGMNFNGFKLTPSAFFGYRPPVAWGLQEIGLTWAMEAWLPGIASSSPAATGGWGSDVWLFELGGRVRVALDPWSSFVLQVSFGSYLEWTADSVSAHRYFGNRVYSATGFGFKELTLAYRYTF